MTTLSSRPDPQNSENNFPNESKKNCESTSLFRKPTFIIACAVFFLLLAETLYVQHKHNKYDTLEFNIAESTVIEQIEPIQPIEPKEKNLRITSPAPDSILEFDNIKDVHTSSKIIKKNDNISSIFKQLSLPGEDLFNLLKDPKNKEIFAQLKVGQKIEIEYNVHSQFNKFVSLKYYLDKLNILTISKDQYNNFISKLSKVDLSEKTSYVKLIINSSLFEDAYKQKVPIDLIYQVIDIFTWDIDFAQDLRKNDSVEILYQEYYLDGKLYTTGNILAVNFYNNGSNYGAVRYEDKTTHHIGYYTPNGLSLHKAFIRTPVKFTRISSKFSTGRSHPILHKIRAHKGVDYAAPTGTPIKAVGDGKIIHYARKAGYGKTAIIQHGSNYSTLYAHMSNYSKTLKHGSMVKQGDTIGYVGQTGMATGPHLHFEFRINNQHVNPLTVALPRARSINDKNKADFTRISNNLIATMQHHSNLHKINNNQNYAVAMNSVKKFE